MTEPASDEIAANLERASLSVQAAKDLAAAGYHDFAGSRAYYAAFYAATAALLAEGLESGKHSGVIALVHHRLVKTGKLSEEMGKNLNWLFELRNVRDYGGLAHVSEEESARAIKTAASLVESIRKLLRP